MRERLLDAGVELLFEDGAKVLGRGLNVAEIAARAEVSEKTFFATFGDKGRYIEALLLRFTHSSHHAYHLTEVIDRAFLDSRGDPRRMLRAVCDRDYRQVRSDPATLMRLATLVLGGGHPGVVKSLRQSYNGYERAGVRAYQPVLTRWNASLRAPFTPEHLAIALTALVEGLALRHLADPGAVPDSLFGDTVVALVGALLDPEQGHGHVDDVMAPLADELVRAHRADNLDDLPEHPRNAVIAAARQEFAGRGYYATTPAHIASRAGVSTAVLTQLFPVKAGIVAGALRGPYAELRSLVDDDLALGVPPTTMLRRHLEQLAAFTLRHREFTEALLMAAAHDPARGGADPVREIDLPALLIPALRAGIAAGHFHGDHDPRDLAEILAHALLLRCLTHPGGAAADHAAAVGALVLHGLLARPGEPVEQCPRGGAPRGGVPDRARPDGGRPNGARPREAVIEGGGQRHATANRGAWGSEVPTGDPERTR
ncbi:TetR/AcrR family transcriptional regulator [Saccharothrix xinjiangensis]|uniref:TetR/AcrR family transcriptional regulator n=1 Tax=Saccharothrix xinjiangensis TaxID=204798 RepID=A0ABV9Y4T1_9PSEU